MLVHCLPIASPICSAGVCLVQMQRQTEAENAAAEAEQLEMQEQEWNMAELERIQEQQVWITLRFPARPAALACSWHHAWCELRLSGLGARCSLSISQSHCTIGQNPTSKRVFLAYHQASSQIGICSVCTGGSHDVEGDADKAAQQNCCCSHYRSSRILVLLSCFHCCCLLSDDVLSGGHVASRHGQKT